MRELRRCDFCGGEAAGTFEIVPPELEPTEGEQRRVVLCPDCEDRLQTLIEPLLARAGAGADGSSSAGATEGEGGNDQRSADETESSADGDSDRTGASETESGTVVASAEESTRKRSRESSPNATVSDPDDGSISEADSGPEAEADAEATDATDESMLEGGITFERSSETTAETGDASESATDESASSDDATANDAATRPPAAYSKVVRLLRNREFPMRRSAVEELAAGAYDLEPDEVDAIIDHAIERDEFAEKRGTLTRPES